MNRDEVRKLIEEALDESKDQWWYHSFEIVKGSGIFPPSYTGQLKVGDEVANGKMVKVR